MIQARAARRQHYRGPSAVPGPRAIPVTPKVAALMGLGDYSEITPGGARISFTGNPPGTTPPPTAAYPDGTLVAAVGTSPTYLIQGGQKAWIPNVTTLDAMGYNVADIQYISAAALAAIPTAAPLPSITVQTSTASTTTAATTAATTSATPVYSSTLESGAVYDSATGYYTNPDGSIYIPPTSNYSATTPTYNSVLEPGAVYNAATGYYTNPDGTIYAPSAVASTSTIDLTSPSTWPTWVWLALAAGGTWLLLFRKR